MEAKELHYVVQGKGGYYCGTDRKRVRFTTSLVRWLTAPLDKRCSGCQEAFEAAGRRGAV